MECADDGREGVDMVARSAPGYYNLILMDIQMPNMNGYQAAREIRSLADPDLNHIPIVALTANSFDEDKDEAYASGMDWHVAKPFDLDKVNEALKEFL